MRSLSTHLRQAEAHGQLAFHPDCPICRQTRLAGALATGGVVSVRAQALLAASLLALSTTAPATTALAGEQDQEHEGSATVAPGDPAENPDFDPGGESTALPPSAPPPAQAPSAPSGSNEESGPVEEAPATNPSEPVVDSGDGSATPTTTTPAAPTSSSQPSSPTAPQDAQPAAAATPSATAADPPPPAAPAGPPAAADPPQTPSATAPNTAAPEPSIRSRARVTKTRRHVARAHTQAPPQQAGSGGGTNDAPAAATSAAPVAATSPQPAQASAATPALAGRAARPGDHTHTVRPSESLWAIASDLLGRDATPARVAREVHRLWQLNRQRIATGDPDLLMIGTTLRLR
jgi:hypothetical protein